MIKPMKLYVKDISSFKNKIGLKVENTPFISMPYGGYTSLSYNVNSSGEESDESSIHYNVNNQIQILSNYKELKISNTALRTNLNKINNDISNYKKIIDVKEINNHKNVTKVKKKSK